jgi:hypothetical protein
MDRLAVWYQHTRMLEMDCKCHLRVYTMRMASLGSGPYANLYLNYHRAASVSLTRARSCAFSTDR